MYNKTLSLSGVLNVLTLYTGINDWSFSYYEKKNNIRKHVGWFKSHYK